MQIPSFMSGLQGGGFNPFAMLDGGAMGNMGDAGGLAQLALRRPDLTAEMLAATGAQPPPAPAASIGNLVAPGTAADAKKTTPVDSMTKALSSLQAEPPQAAMPAPSPISPQRGGQVDSTNIQRMMQLLASPGSLGGRIPSLGALISGR